MHWIYLIHKFHNLSWITEINELLHDIIIYWDAPVCRVGLTKYLHGTWNWIENEHCWLLLQICLFSLWLVYIYIYIYIHTHTHTHTCKYFLHFLYMYVCFFINTYKYTHYINPFLFWMWLIDLTALLDNKITQINHIYSIYTYLNKIYVDINCIKKTIIQFMIFFFFFLQFIKYY